jgi:hypothetical protein
MLFQDWQEVFRFRDNLHLLATQLSKMHINYVTEE